VTPGKLKLRTGPGPKCNQGPLSLLQILVESVDDGLLVLQLPLRLYDNMLTWPTKLLQDPAVGKFESMIQQCARVFTFIEHTAIDITVVIEFCETLKWI
jgi:hypothetical protein